MECALQDGGLYLARPVPLALDSGTEYEVEGSGLPQGWFDIAGAREIGNDWFGFGDWKPYLPPPPKKLHPSRNPPTVVRDKSGDEDKPHFVRRDQSTSSGKHERAPRAQALPPRAKLRIHPRHRQRRWIRTAPGCGAGRTTAQPRSHRPPPRRRNLPARRPMRIVLIFRMASRRT